MEEREIATDHFVGLVLSDFRHPDGRWSAVATFGMHEAEVNAVAKKADEPPKRVHGRRCEFIGRGNTPAAALRKLIAELREPDRREIAKARRNLHALASLPEPA